MQNVPCNVLCSTNTLILILGSFGLHCSFAYLLQLGEFSEQFLIALYKLEAILKIYKKSKFDRNQLKVDKQHKNIYMYQKKI